MVKARPPDIVITDIGMKGLNGLDATARITREHPNTRVVILSVHSDDEYVWQALRAGARGYLLKNADSVELELAIRSVANGEVYLSPAISKRVLDAYLHGAGVGTDPSLLLTPRHREILQLIAEGNTTKQIASILNLSVKTVETHRMQLMDRLDIHDVAGLVRYAIRHHILAYDQ
jgi:DNA-binding NarL/FixJ family response regulator